MSHNYNGVNPIELSNLKICQKFNYKESDYVIDNNQIAEKLNFKSPIYSYVDSDYENGNNELDGISVIQDIIDYNYNYRINNNLINDEAYSIDDLSESLPSDGSDSNDEDMMKVAGINESNLVKTENERNLYNLHNRLYSSKQIYNISSFITHQNISTVQKTTNEKLLQMKNRRLRLRKNHSNENGIKNSVKIDDRSINALINFINGENGNILHNNEIDYGKPKRNKRKKTKLKKSVDINLFKTISSCTDDDIRNIKDLNSNSNNVCDLDINERFANNNDNPNLTSNYFQNNNLSISNEKQDVLFENCEHKFNDEAPINDNDNNFFLINLNCNDKLKNNFKPLKTTPENNHDILDQNKSEYYASEDVFCNCNTILSSLSVCNKHIVNHCNNLDLHLYDNFCSNVEVTNIQNTLSTTIYSISKDYPREETNQFMIVKKKKVPTATLR